MTHFDKQACKIIRVKVEAALEDALDELGITSKIGSIIYSQQDCHFRIDLLAAGSVSKSGRDYLEVAALSPQMPPLGAALVIDGDQIQVTGWNHGAPKYSVEVTRLKDNRKMRYTEKSIISAWTLAKAA